MDHEKSDGGRGRGTFCQLQDYFLSSAGLVVEDCFYVIELLFFFDFPLYFRTLAIWLFKSLFNLRYFEFALTHDINIHI